MGIDKEKLKGLLQAETTSWNADCSEWKRTTEVLDEFLGEKTIEEVALALLEEGERLTRQAQNALGGQMALICERDLLKTDNEALRNSLKGLIHAFDATGWEQHTCGEIAKARELLGKGEQS